MGSISGFLERKRTHILNVVMVAYHTLLLQGYQTDPDAIMDWYDEITTAIAGLEPLIQLAISALGGAGIFFFRRKANRREDVLIAQTRAKTTPVVVAPNGRVTRSAALALLAFGVSLGALTVGGSVAHAQDNLDHSFIGADDPMFQMIQAQKVAEAKSRAIKDYMRRQDTAKFDLTTAMVALTTCTQQAIEGKSWYTRAVVASKGCRETARAMVAMTCMGSVDSRDVRDCVNIMDDKDSPWPSTILGIARLAVGLELGRQGIDELGNVLDKSIDKQPLVVTQPEPIIIDPVVIER